MRTPVQGSAAGWNARRLRKFRHRFRRLLAPAVVLVLVACGAGPAASGGAGGIGEFGTRFVHAVTRQVNRGQCHGFAQQFNRAGTHEFNQQLDKRCRHFTERFARKGGRRRVDSQPGPFRDPNHRHEAKRRPARLEAGLP